MPNRVDIRKLLTEEPETFLRQSMLDQLAVLHVITDDELLSGEPEVIHDFRVAVRTLRTRLEFFEPYFKKPSKIHKWMVELKWLDRHVQALRDIDVQAQLLHMVAAEKLQNLVSKPAKYQTYRNEVLALRSELAAASDVARAKLAVAVQSKRKAALFDDFKKGLLLTTFKPKKLASLSQDLTEALSGKQKVTFRELRKPALAKQSYKKLHSLRLECKKARYLAEAIGAPASQLTKAQSILGDINDLAVLNEWLKARILGGQRNRNRKVVLSLLIQTEILIEQHRLSLAKLGQGE